MRPSQPSLILTTRRTGDETDHSPNDRILATPIVKLFDKTKKVWYDTFVRKINQKKEKAERNKLYAKKFEVS